MSKPIIEVEHLSKCYRIGAMREPYLSLREELAKKTRRISSAFSRAFRKGETGTSGSETDFWALNDVSFSVQEGEAVGIIGRNGAGKSTLLKILSQITPPTKGQITMRGRVASLLEVGTGFHPELTGRENIYLNGAILGMTRAEIRKKFDEIVAFSEIEKFLDTPVKRYSSGMYVRLAFAVAAHLEPEILLVDEVLAVGDAAFQEKCLGKMEDVRGGGRTILFVSHNMAAITNLCSRVHLIHNGHALASEVPSVAIEKYLKLNLSKSYINLSDRKDRKGDGRVRFEDLTISNENDDKINAVTSGQTVRLKLRYTSNSEIALGQLSFGVGIYDTFRRLILCENEMAGCIFRNLPPSGWIVCEIPNFPLYAGRYELNVNCAMNGIVSDWVPNAGTLMVVEGDFYGTGKLPPPSHGGFLTKQVWSHND